MTLNGFLKKLNGKIFRVFTILIVVCSFGSIILISLEKILGGEGLNDVITARGIKTNSISILVLFSVTIVVFIFVTVAVQWNRNRNKKTIKKKLKKT